MGERRGINSRNVSAHPGLVGYMADPGPRGAFDTGLGQRAAGMRRLYVTGDMVRAIGDKLFRGRFKRQVPSPASCRRHCMNELCGRVFFVLCLCAFVRVDMTDGFPPPRPPARPLSPVSG